MNKNAWIVFAILSSLAACADPPPPAKTLPKMIGISEINKIPLSDHEYLYNVTLPDYGLPLHCVVFVNDRTNSSQMRCSQ
jgi:hypothetical protein